MIQLGTSLDSDGDTRFPGTGSGFLILLQVENESSMAQLSVAAAGPHQLATSNYYY